MSQLTIDSLPDDVLFEIMSMIPLHELVPFAKVSKRWNSVINDPHMWRHLAFNKCLHPPRSDDGMIQMIAKAQYLRSVSIENCTEHTRLIDALADNSQQLTNLVIIQCRFDSQTFRGIELAPKWKLTRLHIKHPDTKDIECYKTLFESTTALDSLYILEPKKDDAILDILSGTLKTVKKLCLMWLPSMGSSLVTLLNNIAPTLQVLVLSCVFPRLHTYIKLPLAANLRALQLSQIIFPNHSFPYVAQIFTCLEQLSVICCHEITSSDFLDFFCNTSRNRLTNLYYLNLKYCDSVDDDVVSAIALHCGSSMRLLNLRGCNKFTDHGLTELVARCSIIEHLDICSNHNISCAPLLNSTRATPAPLGLPKLQMLHISDCPKVSVNIRSNLHKTRPYTHIADETNDKCDVDDFPAIWRY